MPRSLQVALIAIVLAIPAHATVPLACESAASLRAKVRDCEGNLAYGAAAKDCADHFDASVAEAQAGVAKALGAVLAAKAQADAMAKAKQGYETAIASLRALASQGRLLEREVAAYKSELVFPDDFGAAGQAGLSAATFLDGQPCYHDSRNLVLTYAEILGLHSKELDLTAKVAGGLAAKAFKGESQLRPEDVLPLLQAKPAQGSASRRARPSQGSSDITGTNKKDKAPGSH